MAYATDGNVVTPEMAITRGNARLTEELLIWMKVNQNLFWRYAYEHAADINELTALPGFAAWERERAGYELWLAGYTAGLTAHKTARTA